MLAKVERFLSNRFPPRSLLLSHNYSPYILPVVIGSTLMAVDRWLTDPAVTEIILLFLLAYLLSCLIRMLRSWGMPPTPWRFLLAALTTGAVLVFASPVMAQVTTASSCSGGLFGPLANFFSDAFTTAGATAAGNEVCTVFGLIQAILAVVFIIAIGIAAYQVGQGAEIRTAFLPAALALLVVVSSGIIIKLFMGT